jgi:hypothetical protein
MHNSTIDGGLAARKKTLLTLVGLFAAVALFFAMTAPKAFATDFCGSSGSPVWVNPYGQGGDRCWGPARQGLNWAAVRTYERAGCVSIAEGTTLLTSWVCGAAGSSPGWIAEAYKYNGGGSWYKGVVRNNNVSYGTHISGTHGCLGNPSC